MLGVGELLVHGTCNCTLMLQVIGSASTRLREILLVMLTATAKSWSTREAPHQPALMGSCLSTSHTCLSCPSSR